MKLTTHPHPSVIYVSDYFELFCWLLLCMNISVCGTMSARHVAF